MCHVVLLASSLTLSEVRSMLPPGLVADLAPPAEQRALKQIQLEAQTVARVLRGSCACDLVTERQAERRADEAGLRKRYRALNLVRTEVLRALEQHRRGREPRPRPEGYWPAAFAEFVGEHARNAGPTLYYRCFTASGPCPGLPQDGAIGQRTVAEVRQHPGSWLPEATPVLVIR